MNLSSESVLQNIETEIRRILYEYIKAASFTFTPGEKQAERFFINYFQQQEYFKTNKEFFGAVPIKDDPLNRAVCFAMTKGTGQDTVVMIHHSDVVTTEDFKLLAPLAFSPDQLHQELLGMADTLQEEARSDLFSGDYLFGRGVCDMKGGGAIQMALIKRYGQLLLQQEKVKGNLIVLAVPDEENLSAGMRSAVLLLAELQKKYKLKYRLMINSEPHQRKDPEKGVFSVGSVGKMLPFFYIRGSLAHAGKVFEGFNPTNLMSAIVRKTEMNMDFADVVGKEAAPPPTWLYLRDDKTGYDVSMPLSVCGCLSVLTLNQTPLTLMEKIRRLCLESFDEVLQDMNENYAKFLKATGQPQTALPWSSKAVDFSQLKKEAEACRGEAFRRAYEAKLHELSVKQKSGELNLIQCNFQLVDFVFDYIDDLSPRIVYGLIPPYYPNVSNTFSELAPEDVRALPAALNQFTEETFGQSYTEEAFYTGISDLSYSSISQSETVIEALEETMPLLGSFYHLPLDAVEAISMPCINIGPWGKDFHKLTERVLKEDLYQRTPRILQKAIEIILG